MNKATIVIENRDGVLVVAIGAEGGNDPKGEIRAMLTGEAQFECREGSDIRDLLLAALDTIVDECQSDEALEDLVFEWHGESLAAADLFTEEEADDCDEYEDEADDCDGPESEESNAQRRLDEMQGRSHGRV